MRAALAGLIALACAGCASAPPPPDPVSQLPALEGRIYELINAQRLTLDPHAKVLTLDSELVGVARQRSVGMAAKNNFADGTGDPHISATRLMAEDAKFQGLLGENVAAQRYTKTAGIDVEHCATQFVASWLASPSHKENLAFAEYSRTGIGAALNGDTIYVTQLFATELTLKPRIAGRPPQIRSFPSARAAKGDPGSTGTGSRPRGASPSP
jgi:uncharacterized protein YkwD